MTVSIFDPFNFVWIILYKLFLLTGLKWVVKKESEILPSQNGRNEWSKGANSCPYIFYHDFNLIH